MIFHIQKCSIHDGGGLRTLVFFKGCPLRCKWCANPESQSFLPEIMESRNKCIGCLRCREVCPAGAIRLEETGPVIDRSLCRRCFRCTEICYAGAKYVAGTEETAQALFREIDKDRTFYGLSGGGVTFSGGEPLAQPKALEEIARLCHDGGIHVMLESCGHAAFSSFQGVLPYIDAMFLDLKHIDPAVHKALTGADNRLVLENIQKISDFGVPITVRTPVVPGCNADEANITGIAAFIRDIPGVRGYELLAYHNLGEFKYRALGRDYPLRGLESPAPADMAALQDAANRVLAGSGKLCFFEESPSI